MITATLTYLVDDQKVCLALKKKGFGVGKYNGVGGKRNSEEDIVDTAVRETFEEICVNVKPQDLTEVGQLNFQFNQKPENEFYVYVYTTKRWEGEPVETEEMCPYWFGHSQLPYEKMWCGDSHFLPDILSGKYVKATILFSADGDSVIRYQKEAHPI